MRHDFIIREKLLKHDNELINHGSKFLILYLFFFFMSFVGFHSNPGFCGYQLFVTNAFNCANLYPEYSFNCISNEAE